MEIKLAGSSRLLGTLELLSGLHIGAGKERIEIGGIDNPVIKHPLTQEPYIPGSSMKGKLRCLLEWAFGTVEPDGQVWGSNQGRTYDSDDPVLRIFGTTHKQWKGGPTRIAVRDAFLEPEWRDKVLARGLPLTEDKTEVLIDRLQGKAHDRVGPRQTERVPEGARFNTEILFRRYDLGDAGARDRQCFNWLIHGLKVLEQDALGGSGSRGYGRLRFSTLRVIDEAGGERNIKTAFDALGPFDPQRAPTIV